MTDVVFPPKPKSIPQFKQMKPEDFMPKQAGRDPLLTERQTTHGNFSDNARLSQTLKEVFRAQPGWTELHDVEREAMDMIALKFSRILSGKSLEKQHWEDVTGYSKLVEEICK